MSHLDTKRKSIESNGLVRLSKDEAIEAFRKQHYCSGEKKTREREIGREKVDYNIYLVTKAVEEDDPDERERRYWLRQAEEGSIDVYRNKEGKLIVFPPDEVLEKWDKE